MTKITIGIIARDEEINNTKMQIITKNNLKYLHHKCNYIGILNYDNTPIDLNIISLCDAIIFQGGSTIYPYHFQILDYCLKNNIPVLGICMGHQIIGLYSNNTPNESELVKVNNHNNPSKYHLINIKPNTTMYQIFGPTLKVNTRHNYTLSKVTSPFIISAVSPDNQIEAIEYINNKNFILGVQFHPEDLDNTEKLYNYFIEEIMKRKK